MTFSFIFISMVALSFFAVGYGFGNLVERKMVDQHGEEIDALCDTIDELYTGLEMVYKAYSGNAVSEEQAREAAERAEYLLLTIKSPNQVAAAIK